MSRLRVLSGGEVLKILGEFGFQDFAQRGSHIKLRRILSGGRAQTLTVPNHDEIDRGTLHAITGRQRGTSRNPSCAASSSRSEE
jgi:predicted RNA binding protein YcfA (HicA-like mRNA interferase family)